MIYMLGIDENSGEPCRIDSEGNKEILVNGFTDEWKKAE